MPVCSFIISRSEQDKRKKYGPHENGRFCDTYLDTRFSQSISGPRLQSIQFAIHTFLPFILPLAKHSDSLKNVARQNRTKRKENLEFIACAEGKWFVFHSNRADF